MSTTGWKHTAKRDDLERANRQVVALCERIQAAIADGFFDPARCDENCTHRA